MRSYFNNTYQGADDVVGWSAVAGETQPLVALLSVPLDDSICARRGLIVLPPTMNLGDAVAIMYRDDLRTTYTSDGVMLTSSVVTTMDPVAQHMYRLLVDDLVTPVEKVITGSPPRDVAAITELRTLLS